jgi:CCR4-NOT transcription complex subunit 2
VLLAAFVSSRCLLRISESEASRQAKSSISPSAITLIQQQQRQLPDAMPRRFAPRDATNATPRVTAIVAEPMSQLRRGAETFAADIFSFSDFPTLSTGPGARPQQNSGWNSNVIRQPPTQTQPPSQPPPEQQSAQRAPSAAPSHQSMDQFEGQRTQQPAGDRGGNGGDDFPPLSGQQNGEPTRQSNGFSSTIESPEPSHPQPNGQQTQLPIREASNSFQQPQQTPINASTSAAQNQSQSQAPSNQTPTSTQPPPSGVKTWADMSEQEHFGLMGLSALFEARKQHDLGGQPDPTIPPEWSNSVLGMGQDLNTLGMDLDSPDPLYTTFHVFPDSTGTGSMYDSRSRHPVPAFEVPVAYMVNNVPQMHSRINAFSDGMFGV